MFKLKRFILISLFLGFIIISFTPAKVFANEKQIQSNAKILPNGKVVFLKKKDSFLPQKPKQKVFLGFEADRVQIKILDRPDLFYSFGQFELDLSELDLNSPFKITARSFGIHGVGQTFEQRVDQSIIFQAYNIGDQSIWTTEIILPKGVLKPTLWQKILFWSANYSLPWFILSITLFFVVLSVIAFLIWKRHQLEKIPPSNRVITAPPTNLSSASLAILEEKKAAQRAIAAGILYLAARGFLTVIKTPHGFVVAKYKEPGEIAGIDQEFYNLLIGNWFAQSIQQIRIETSRDLFNYAAGEIHRELYHDLSRRGLFVGDPWLSIHKTRLIGISAFFLTVIGFYASLSILPYPPFASLIWAGLMIASLLIIKIASLMPIRSQKGAKERQEWHEFKRFLSDSQPRMTMDLPMDIYLHYAIALKCEDKWILRFATSNYRVPPWYIGPSVTVEDIAADIVAFVNEFSNVIDEGIPPEEK